MRDKGKTFAEVKEFLLASAARKKEWPWDATLDDDDEYEYVLTEMGWEAYYERGDSASRVR